MDNDQISPNKKFLVRKIAVLILCVIYLSACKLNPFIVGNSPTVTHDIDSTITAAVMTIYSEATEIVQIAKLSETATQTLSASTTQTSTITHTPIPSSTSTITKTATSSATVTPLPSNFVPENAIFIYFVQLDTGGPIGCGDSLVKIWTGHVKSGNLINDLSVAINSMFRAGHYHGGLYNATYLSNLQVTGIEFDAGRADVHLDGSYSVPIDSCDASRYQSQVRATALQFDEINRFVPWVRDKLLEDLLAIYSDS